MPKSYEIGLGVLFAVGLIALVPLGAWLADVTGDLVFWVMGATVVYGLIRFGKWAIK